MHKNYPQYIEAGNERCVYVMRESEKLAPINLDELREERKNHHHHYEYRQHAHRLL